MGAIEIGYAIYKFIVENIIATFGISVVLAFMVGMWLKSALKGFFSWIWMVIIFVFILFLVSIVLALVIKPDILTSIIGGVILG